MFPVEVGFGRADRANGVVTIEAAGRLIKEEERGSIVAQTVAGRDAGEQGGVELVRFAGGLEVLIDLVDVVEMAKGALMTVQYLSMPQSERGSRGKLLQNPQVDQP